MNIDETEKTIRSRSVARTSNINEKEVTEDVDTTDDHPSLRDDKWNVALLLFLYLLQGIPLGLSAAVPIILQDRHISYEDQAEFSFVTWPFSLKLLWAPIVDSLYWEKFGRRKSWLIPVQYLLGFFLLLISCYADEWIGDEAGIHQPNIKLLTLTFFCTNFLAATQDIAVDGWALTMLHRKNVGHASTCNSVGQTAGFFLGYVVFVILVSPEFCNKWIRTIPQDTGLVTFSEFVQMWGIIFIVTTTLVALLKKEQTGNIATEDQFNIPDSYRLLFKIFKLSAVQKISVILLTCKIGFAAVDVVTPLKLIEVGLSKEKIAFLAIPLIPLQMFIPFLISKYIIGPRPLDVFVHAFPYRIFVGLLACLLVYVTPYLITKDDVPWHYYVILLLVYTPHQVLLYCMFVAGMAFYAKISDPRCGGTYMTLLNTLTNLGGVWPATVSLWLVDKLTWKYCVTVNTCLDLNTTMSTATNCTKEVCTTTLDGYYVEVLLCSTIGILWLYWSRKDMEHLQNLDESAWQVN